mmetsp:Transcript_74349/g.177355  ORF Transcript_74349/g.177355 Transcript_74349/m.177355 type:complete len:305 (+) Transcript_74349:913-1827(+)
MDLLQAYCPHRPGLLAHAGGGFGMPGDCAAAADPDTQCAGLHLRRHHRLSAAPRVGARPLRDGDADVRGGECAAGLLQRAEGAGAGAGAAADGVLCAAAALRQRHPHGHRLLRHHAYGPAHQSTHQRRRRDDAAFEHPHERPAGQRAAPGGRHADGLPHLLEAVDFVPDHRAPYHLQLPDLRPLGAQGEALHPMRHGRGQLYRHRRHLQHPHGAGLLHRGIRIRQLLRLHQYVLRPWGQKRIRGGLHDSLHHILEPGHCGADSLVWWAAGVRREWTDEHRLAHHLPIVLEHDEQRLHLPGKCLQ